MKTGIPIIVATLATRAIDPRRSHLAKKSKKPLSNRWLKKRLKNHAIAMVVRRLKKKNISQRWAFWELISHSVRGSASSWLVSTAGFVAEGSTLLSFGASHHRHFGMSSSYSLPHFLQIMLASAGQCRKTLGVILWDFVILRRRAVYFWIYFFVRIGCFYVADIQLGDCFLIQYRLLNQLHVDEQGDN